MDKIIYYDTDGNERSLNWMIKNQTGWTHSRMSFYAKEFPLRDEEIKTLHKSCNNYKQMYVRELKENKKLKEELQIVYKSLIAKDYIAAVELLSEILEADS